ncbi:unnamed protein product [Rhizoctonia solani]|uniref:Uncharacterized protein n=1 Tax=Rhizoctonia solani TaxID=456999 RepID=A0A8H3GG41_9AGAM|nr:unnamed protein product [Rhizoctonia solani]
MEARTSFESTAPWIMYPDYLAQVCSFWRCTALSSPSFWTHMDFVLSNSRIPIRGCMNRARVHAKRAGESPLQIHIAESGHSSYLNLEEFFKDSFGPVLGRMKDLELVIRSPFEATSHGLILKTLLSGCVPQNLTRFSMKSHFSQFNGFIGSSKDKSDLHKYDISLLIDLTTDHIESIFTHLTVLDMRGIFPKWTSAAYHGLVELRLSSRLYYTDDVPWNSITELELARILQASPGLRILYFQLLIKSNPMHNTPMIPVYLKDLEVLSIVSQGPSYISMYDRKTLAESIGRLLRLITPGSQPLRLTLETDSYGNDYSFGEIKNFFMRSNIVRFCARYAYPPLYELLPYMQNLQNLAFHSCGFGKGTEVFLAQGEGNPISSRFCGNSWRIHSCQMSLDTLSTIIHMCPSEKLKVFKCQIRRNPTTKFQSNGQLVHTGELSAMFPSVKFIPSTDRSDDCYDPTAGWDGLE